MEQISTRSSRDHKNYSVIMNSDLHLLQPYPFTKLNQLKAAVTPPEHLQHIALSIGEPKHTPPHFVLENLIAHSHQLAQYPLTKGTTTLRESIQQWLCQRFALDEQSLDSEKNILPVNGTREALFAIAQCIIDRQKPNASVLMPNPFYQIYEGAALLAGAQPVLLDCVAENNFLPDLEQVSAAQWRDCQLLYLCSPGNPTGAVMPVAYLQKAIQLAEQYDFVIASDECYSEIYFNEEHPPAGLLQAASLMGNTTYKHCLVFHSLSKRSNLPGLRSGFVAGDADIMQQFLLYRTYHGCAMSPTIQTASISAWNDEQHVIDNRRLYQQKFTAVIDILKDSLTPNLPDAGFYLWAKTPESDIDFAQKLYAEQNITALPGQYLSRDHAGKNPGKGYIRMALVAPLDECQDAAQRINTLFKEHY